MSTTYSNAILDYIEAQASTIKAVSNLIGVRPEAVAGAIAEEYEKFKDEYVYEGLFNALGLLQNDSDLHAILWAEFHSGDMGIWDLPLGKGSVRVSTAICLLLEYLNSAREKGDDIQNDAIYQMLLHFENNFGALCYAMMDENNPTAIIMTALMLKKADQFYSGTLPENTNLDMPSYYRSMFASNNGQTKLAWSLFDQDRMTGPQKWCQVK